MHQRYLAGSVPIRGVELNQALDLLTQGSFALAFLHVLHIALELESRSLFCHLNFLSSGLGRVLQPAPVRLTLYLGTTMT